jgi:Protein of unknown function (DUF1552)
MSSRRSSRRSVLKQLGIGAGLVPLLNATKSFGAAPVFPKRLLIVVWTNGTIPAQFWPQGNGISLDALKLPAITAPLEPHKKDLLFIDGLETRNFTDVPGVGTFGHQNYSTTFTGTRGNLIPNGEGTEPKITPVSASIDQYIAEDIAKRNALPVRSLHLAVLRGGNANSNCCTYRSAGTPVAPENDPAAAASRIFTNQNQPSAAIDQINRARAERRSILDFVGRDLATFGKNMGTADRTKVEAHLDGVRELEKQLATLGTVTCNDPAVPPVAQTVPNYPAILNAHTSVIAAAFKCDLTRVATLQLGSYNGDGITFPWIGVDGPGLGDYSVRTWHDVAHTPIDPTNPTKGNEDTKVKVDTWFLQQFAALIQKFKDVPEGAGTMLDNSVILLANHMTIGSRHNWDNLPWVLAGGCGGYFKTGRYLHAPAHTPTNKLFVGLAQAMGVTVPGDSFGNSEYAGLLPDLSA